MKRFVVYIMLLVLNLVGFAQSRDTLLKHYKTYSVTATDFNVDQMGNLYLVTPGMQLKKVTANGDSMAVYNLSKRYGKLTTIDVSNPLKVLLYYQDYSTIITVDRLLTVTNTIDLRRQNIYQVKAMATSYDSQFWFYDEQEARLKKINDKGKITQQSVDLRQLIHQLPAPQKIIDNDNLVYVCDSKKGVYVFDYYGALKTTVPMTGWNSLFAFNKTLYGLQKDTLQKYTLGMPGTRQVVLSGMEIPKKMVVAGNKIYFLYPKEIRVYYNQ